MSWRDARARVNSGFYKPKEESPLATGFAAAADIVAKSWMQDAADEKEAEKDRLKEEKAERKRIREEQREKEKKDQENRNTAKAAIAQAQLPSSPEIFQQAFVMAQGGADQSKIYDYFISGINKGDIEMVGPEQGPGMPSNTNILTDLESGSGGSNALLNQSQNSQFSDINVSTMPISEVMAFQQKRGAGSYHAWSKENMPDGTEAKEQGLGSTPVGKYQFVGDTLKDLKENGTLDELGITDDTIFDEKTQDALFVRYAQDRLKGKTTDGERIAEMRNIWEGLKKASDEEVLSVIAGIETGTFDEGAVVEDRSMMRGETAIFNPPEREREDIDISGIKTFQDWQAFGSNLKANQSEYSEEWREEYEARGNQLFREYLVTADVKDLRTSISVDPNMDQSKKNTIQDAILIKQSGQWQDTLLPGNLSGKSYGDIENLIIVAEAAGATSEDVKLAKQIASEIKTAENMPTYRKYGESATSYDKTLSQIALAVEEGADQKIIDRLQTLAAAQQKGDIAEKFGVPQQSVGETVVTLPDGTQSFKLVVKKPDDKAAGGLVYMDGAGKPLVEGNDYTFMRDMEKEESTAFHKISVQINKYNMEAQEAKTAIAEGLLNAERALAFAKEDPRVRNFSGDLAQGITNVFRAGSGVLGVMESLFEGKPEDHVVTEEQFRAAVASKIPNSEQLVDAIVSGDVQTLGDKTAMFEASMLSLVFRAGRMEGQSGNAMSNKDFERLSEMLNVKGGIEAFEQTLRSFMADKITTYNIKAENLLTGPPNDFKELYGYLPVSEPLSFEEFVTGFGDEKLSNAYQNTVSYSPSAVVEEDSTVASILEDFVNKESVMVSIGEGDPFAFSKQAFEASLETLNEELRNGQKTKEEYDKEYDKFIQGSATLLKTTPEKLKKMMGL